MSFSEYDLETRLTELGSENIQGLRDLFNCRDTVDAWQHERMLRFVSPLISTYPNAHWLTVGDGGGDAWILRRVCGVRTVSASSISDARLKKAKELGYLDGIDVRALNAEHLDLPTQSVDLLLCSLACHHFRRAPLAFYEFMRVSRIGFILIEPAEFPRRLLDVIRTLVKILLRKRRPIYDLFEPSGNYIYRVSEREIFRMLTAVQLPWFAVKTFNDFNNGWLAAQHRDAFLARSIFQIGVAVQDILCLCRLMNPGLSVVFVPTSPIGESAQAPLRAAHFRIIPIPKNPYTTDGHARNLI